MAYVYPVQNDTFEQKMNVLNGLVATIARENAPSYTDWAFLEELTSDGALSEMYDIGTTFTEDWKDTATGTVYSFPWALNHIGDVELQDGETLTDRAFLQLKYAHPTQGEVTLEGEGIQSVRIVNAYGQTVYNAKVEGEQVRIDLSQMAKGVYMMYIDANQGQTVKKVVVK